jgi:hypothetical protein
VRIEELKDKINQAQNNAEIWTAIWALQDVILLIDKQNQ